jgi:hypothetical protein
MTETQTILANELRIGNWVNTSVEPTLLTDYNKVKEITSDALVCENVGACDWSDITPIPLTPEILEKAGFEDDLPWKKNNFCLDSECRFHVVDGTGYGVIIARQIKFVHQLQNLYFALTGEELEINL